MTRSRLRLLASPRISQLLAGVSHRLACGRKTPWTASSSHLLTAGSYERGDNTAKPDRQRISRLQQKPLMYSALLTGPAVLQVLNGACHSYTSCWCLETHVAGGAATTLLPAIAFECRIPQLTTSRTSPRMNRLPQPLNRYTQGRQVQRPLQAAPQRCRPARGGYGALCSANPTQQQEATAPRRQAGSDLTSSTDDGDVYDIVAAARRKTAKSAEADAPEAPLRPLSQFFSKCAAAYRIFFPPQQRNLSPKELGRNRLRMILVADRCSMNPSSLSDMKYDCLLCYCSRCLPDRVAVSQIKLITNVSGD